MGKRFRRLIDIFHRYIGLLVFAQVLLWSIGGALIHSLDFSDLYVDPPPKPLRMTGPGLSPQQLQTRLNALAPGSHLIGAQLRNLAGKPIYRIEHDKGAPLMLDEAGQVLKSLDAALAKAVAQAGYTGTGTLSEAELLSASSGNYFSASPVWRVRFADSQKTEIYIDPVTGELLARRKALWALYNRMWEFHLMKYTPSKAVNKALLVIFALLNVLVALTGFIKFFRWGYRMRKPAQANL